MLSTRLTALAVESAIAPLRVDADYRSKLFEAALNFATPDKSREEIERYTLAAYYAFRLSGPVTRAAFAVLGLDPQDCNNRDQFNELSQLAYQFIIELAKSNTDSSYLFTSAKRHILKHYFEDSSLRIPARTYHDCVARGDKPPAFERHSWDDTFNGNGLRRTMPNIWRLAEWQWLAPDSVYEEERKAAETWELLLSFCRDETDRAILQWLCQGLDKDDVALVLGISLSTVKRRLLRIQINYYLFHDWRMPRRGSDGA